MCKVTITTKIRDGVQDFLQDKHSIHAFSDANAQSGVVIRLAFVRIDGSFRGLNGFDLSRGLENRLEIATF